LTNASQKILIFPFTGRTAKTEMMELLIVYHKCFTYLEEKGIEITANYVGNLLTVQEAAGFQMFMARMDEELMECWNAPCKAAYFRK